MQIYSLLGERKQNPVGLCFLSISELKSIKNFMHTRKKNSCLRSRPVRFCIFTLTSDL